MLVLKLVIFRYGVFDITTQASPGAKLQNLKLASPSSPGHKRMRYRRLHGVLLIQSVKLRVESFYSTSFYILLYFQLIYSHAFASMLLLVNGLTYPLLNGDGKLGEHS